MASRMKALYNQVQLLYLSLSRTIFPHFLFFESSYKIVTLFSNFLNKSRIFSK